MYSVGIWVSLSSIELLGSERIEGESIACSCTQASVHLGSRFGGQLDNSVTVDLLMLCGYCHFYLSS